MNVSFLLIFVLIRFAHPLCSETSLCIERIRRLVAEPRRFWFGEQWKEICSGRNRNAIDCYNPHALQPFHSLGGRLFRVKTYQAAFLQNLRLYPRVTFRAQPGTYRACDHDFVVDKPGRSIIEVDPDMEPVEPFNIRYLPDIRWPGISRNDTFIILITDAGFGTLNFVAYDYPKNSKVLQHYKPSENFRPLVNPLVVIVFQQAPKRDYGNLKITDGSELFSLPKFMIDNALESDLVGMNIVMVSADAYSIEKQRIRAIVDNCHSLIQQKLRKDNRWSFVNAFPLSEMDTSLSVDYQQPAVSYEVCCEQIDLWDMWLPLDPLGDGNLPSLVVHNEPRVSAIRIPQNNANYQRSARDFVGVVLFDYSYSLVLFDPDRAFLHWLIIDIPSASLAASSINDGKTIVSYLAPVPNTPKSCSMLVFMLFRQPRYSSISPLSQYFDNEYSSLFNECKNNCSQRLNFDIEQFKAFHQLRISAINWMSVCYDIHEAKRQIDLLVQNRSKEELRKTTTLDDSTFARNSHEQEHNWERRLSPEAIICPLVKSVDELQCDKASSFSRDQNLFVSLLSIIIVLLLRY